MFVPALTGCGRFGKTKPERRDEHMGNPKRKHSNHRSGNRRAHNALRAAGTSVCGNCGYEKLPHTICPNCGQYKRRAVVEV